MTRLLRLVPVVCALVAVWPSAAAADLSHRLSNAQLTATSDVILIGRATASASRWVGRTLVTAVTVEVEETLKGGAQPTVEVILPGGIDVNRPVPVGMSYPGAPTMRQGERVFLFLSRDAEVGGLIVSGFAQGKFSVFADATGVARVSRDLRGSQLVEGTGVARGTVTLASLDDFKREVAGYLAQ